jgi:hypothetical protein
LGKNPTLPSSNFLLWDEIPLFSETTDVIHKLQTYSPAFSAYSPETPKRGGKEKFCAQKKSRQSMAALL